MLSSHSDSASNSSFDDGSSLEYVVNHVFFTVYPPGEDDYTPENAHILAHAVHAAALAYEERIDRVHKPRWLHIIKMLQNLQAILEPQAQPRKELNPSEGRISNEPIQRQDLNRDRVVVQLGEMKAGGRLWS